MKRSITVLMLAGMLSACGGGEPELDNKGTSRNVVSATESAEAMAPCKAVAEQYPVLEARVAALHLLADAATVCAQYGLGTLYVMGYETIEPDPEQARYYLTLAAGQGHEDAARELASYFPEP